MRRLLLAALLTACVNPFAPAEPWKAGAVPYTSPLLAELWQKTEACEGLTGDFSLVRFYLTPQRFKTPGEGGTLLAAGVWVKEENSIYIAQGYETITGLVMHEELHALLQDTGHPTKYFIHSSCGPLM